MEFVENTLFKSYSISVLFVMNFGCCDTSLLAKLSTSDMHTLDAHYHRKCLLALYNRMRKHCKDDARFIGDNSMSVEAVALAELVSYMEESALDDDTVPVYKLSNLIKLYRTRRTFCGV